MLLTLTGVAVEKVAFLENPLKFGYRKCLGDPRESFIAHPDAILFSQFSREGVFQQPQAITLIDPARIADPGSMSAIAIFRQLKTIA